MNETPKKSILLKKKWPAAISTSLNKLNFEKNMDRFCKQQQKQSMDLKMHIAGKTKKKWPAAISANLEKLSFEKNTDIGSKNAFY